MEDLSADDDLLSDVLVDTFEFDPPISTHKMNPAYRPARFSTSEVMNIVRNHVVVEADLLKAAEEISKLGIVRKHLLGKSTKQVAGFQQHARRYLETYLADSGVEFALTDRYLTVPERGKKPSSSKDGSSDASGSKTIAITHPHPQQRGGDRSSTKTGGAAPPGTKADLRVLAMKNFAIGDLIINCKGGIKDLTKAEDEALREEAALSREARRENKYKGVLGQGRDFSVVRSSRKGCSQLFLGPARFVNHDCNPNTEFHRLGSQMVFRAIRPIPIGSEITTFYGENYFEWGNSECLCQTCEDRGKGAWGKLEDFPLPPDLLCSSGSGVNPTGSASASTSNGNLTQAQVEEPAEDAKGTLRRRSSARRSITNSSKGSSHQPSESPKPSSSQTNGEAGPSSLASSSSSLQLPPNAPSCKCVTCGALFDPPETWWTPDECGRCERHYKIFKNDWPSRETTEAFQAARQGRGSASAVLKVGKGKGKAKAEDTDSDEEVKVKSHVKAKGRTSSGSGKANGRVASGSNKGRKSSNNLDSSSTTSTGLSTDEFSESSTPIKLSPLRDLQGPSDYYQPKTKVKKSRKSGANTSQSTLRRGEDTTPRNNKTSTRNGLDDSGSDLTEDESESGSASGIGVRSEHRKVLDPSPSSNADDDDATTASSSDSSVTGPKMLGKEATTGTLALFWGAPEGDSRARRQSAKAPVPVQTSQSSANVKTEPKQRSFSHQRTGSGNFDNLRRSSSSAASGSAEAKNVGKKENLVVRDEVEDVKPPPFNSFGKMKKSGRKPHENEIADISHAPGTNGTSLSKPSVAANREDVKIEDALSREASISSSSSSSPPAIPGLATQGTARTSLSNLALAWSAPSDSSRTRKQASKEPFTLSSTTSSEERDLNSHPAKRARRSAGTILTASSSRSETPELIPRTCASSVSSSQSSLQNDLKRPRGRPPQKSRSSLDAEEAVLKSNNKSSNGYQSRHSTGNQLESITGSSHRPRSPLAGPSRGAGSNLPEADSSLNDERDYKKPKLEMNPGPSYGWPASASSSKGSQNVNLNSKGSFLQNSISLTSQPNLPRQPTNSQPGFVGGATASPPASTSPLVPRPASGGPIRKNLRWGRGKVSESRALGGDGSDGDMSPKKAALPASPASLNPNTHSRSTSSSGLGSSAQILSIPDPKLSENKNGSNGTIFPSSSGAHSSAMSSIDAPAPPTSSSSSSNQSIFQGNNSSPSKESNINLPAPSLFSSSFGQKEQLATSAPSFFTSSDPQIAHTPQASLPLDLGQMVVPSVGMEHEMPSVGMEHELNELGGKNSRVEVGNDQIENTNIAPSQIFQPENQQV